MHGYNGLLVLWPSSERWVRFMSLFLVLPFPYWPMFVDVFLASLGSFRQPLNERTAATEGESVDRALRDAAHSRAQDEESRGESARVQGRQPPPTTKQ